MQTVEAFLAGLDAETAILVNELRRIVSGSHAELAERIKWNAPSFAVAGDDRITLGIDRKGGVRLVLHRGAKAKDMAGFQFDDTHGLATWPAPDRGVIHFKTASALEENRGALTDLCRRWIEQTA